MEIKQKKAGLCPWLQPCLKACMLASQAPCLGGGPGFPGSVGLPPGGKALVPGRFLAPLLMLGHVWGLQAACPVTEQGPGVGGSSKHWPLERSELLQERGWRHMYLGHL